MAASLDALGNQQQLFFNDLGVVASGFDWRFGAGTATHDAVVGALADGSSPFNGLIADVAGTRTLFALVWSSLSSQTSCVVC